LLNSIDIGEFLINSLPSRLTVYLISSPIEMFKEIFPDGDFASNILLAQIELALINTLIITAKKTALMAIFLINELYLIKIKQKEEP
jgi:hypothetical protein